MDKDIDIEKVQREYIGELLRQTRAKSLRKPTLDDYDSFKYLNPPKSKPVRNKGQDWVANRRGW